MNKNACVLWTGGKDSCYAAMLAQEQGWSIAKLVLFVPEGHVEFKAHPLEFIQRQARAMDLPLELITIAEPYRESYIKAFREMTDIEAIVTGDIDLVDGCPNWIDECVAESGRPFLVLKPLWNHDRRTLIKEMVARGMEIAFSYIANPHMPQEWIGTTIDSKRIEDLERLGEEHDVDPCGENGEFHTMVTWCPLFKERAG
jgi:uncharacterized protein (TIGR00290 family)